MSQEIYRPLKVEMRNLNISDQSKEKILETLKYLHGEVWMTVFLNSMFCLSVL